MMKNDGFPENFEVRKVVPYGVRWTPRAWLWAQKQSRNIPGWFLSDFGTSENFRKIRGFDPEFRHKSASDQVVCRRIWLKLGESQGLR